MKPATKIRFRGTVARLSDASAHLELPGDTVLVERGRPRLLMISCPCGCGELFPINLDPRAGPAWRLYSDPRRGVSLYPSVWRESGCESHYVIWRNRIYLFGTYEDELNSASADELTKLVELVMDRLPTEGLVSFYDIAESLNAIPWDVLTVCRRLVRMRVAREGKGKQRGSFARA
jgi:Family of unknown function (DUF6527)